jgi:hypothetical protein
MFFHRFEKRALRFWRCSIDFVGENELREDRSRLKLEFAFVLLKDRHADDIGGQQVAGELDALVCQAEYPGERLCENRLAQSGKVFDQEVAAGQQAAESERNFRVFTQYDAAERLSGLVDGSTLRIRAQR